MKEDCYDYENAGDINITGIVVFIRLMVVLNFFDTSCNNSG